MGATRRTELQPSSSAGVKVFRRSPFSRVSAGHVVMIMAGLLALLLNVLLLRSRGETVEVLVASHAISAGSRLVADDLSPVSVESGGPFVNRVLTEESADPLLGYVVVRDIAAGAPLISDDLRAPAFAENERAMSIPISSDHAVGAGLYVGDRVDVIAVEEGSSRFVGTAIEVIDVRFGGGRTSGDDLEVVVVVSPTEALAIAGALDGSAVHLIRSTGLDAMSDESPTQESSSSSGESRP